MPSIVNDEALIGKSDIGATMNVISAFILYSIISRCANYGSLLLHIICIMIIINIGECEYKTLIGGFRRIVISHQAVSLLFTTQN